MKWLMVLFMALPVLASAQLVPDPALVQTRTVVAAGITLPPTLQVFATKQPDALGKRRNMVWLRYQPPGTQGIEIQVVRGDWIKRPETTMSRYEEDVCVIDWATGAPWDPTFTQTGGDEHRTFCCGAQGNECFDELPPCFPNCLQATAGEPLPLTAETHAAQQALAQELLDLFEGGTGITADLGGGGGSAGLVTFREKYRYEHAAIVSNLRTIATPPVTMAYPGAVSSIEVGGSTGT